MKKKLQTKLFYNASSQIVGRVISTVLGIFTITLMAKYLGAEGFGQYIIVTTFLQFFGILVDMGLTLTTAQMISEPDANEKKIMDNIFSLRVISAILFLGMAPVISLFFPYPPIVKVGIFLCTFSYFFTSVFQIFTGIFQKYLVTYKAAISETICRLILLLTIILFIFLDYGLLGIITAIIISNFCQLLFYYYFSVDYIKISWEIDIKLWKNIFLRTWPIFVTSALNLIYFKTDTIFLSIFRPETEVGIYGAAYRVLEVIITIPFLFCGLLLPLLTTYWGTKNKRDFNNIMQQGFNTLIIMSIPMVVGILFLATPIMVAIAGEEFVSSGNILRILVFATFIIFVNSLFSHAIISINKQREIITAYVITAILSIIGYLIFIPLYAGYGAAGMTVLTETLVASIIFFTFYKTTKFFPKLNVFFKSLVASFFMGIFLYIFLFVYNVPQTKFILSFEICGSIIIYFASLYLVGGVSPEIVKIIRRPRK